MSNSFLAAFPSLHDLFDSTFKSDGESSGLDYLASAKDYPYKLVLGLLTAISARYIHKTLQRANIFSDLDGPAPASSIDILQGDEGLLFSFENSLPIHNELLNRYGSVCRLKGTLGEDRLWVADPRAMSEILLKGSDYFHISEEFITWTTLAFGPTIIGTIGHKHKTQRKILNPVFTAAHMRNLTPIFNIITHHLEDIVTSKVRAGGGSTGVVDMYTWMSNVALEMIGQAGVGYSFGVMENKEPEYLDASRQVFPLMNSMWYMRPFLPTLMKIGPARFRRFVVDRVSFGPVQQFQKAADIMDKMATEIYTQKKRALANGTLESEVAAGNDIISALLKQNGVVPPEEQMTEEEILSQVNIFIFAGHDTTSSGLARTLLRCPTYADPRQEHLSSKGHDFLRLSFLFHAPCALEPLFDYVKATGRFSDLLR